MKHILKFIKDIWLGLFLIMATSSLLLVSDLGRRGEKKARIPDKVIRLAIMQWAATDLLDSTVKGIVEGLRQQGFEEGATVTLRIFNASGDSATGNMMAKDLVGGGYDMVFTASTLALQAVAAANREGRVRHLFAAVTDPYGAGVGIKGPKPEERPAHLLGIGTFQPVVHLFRTAKIMNPSLGKVGVVWSPAEDNSAACLDKARMVCRELGIELLEANAGNTSEVPESLRSLLSKGVDAVWIGGDTVAIAAINGILAVTQAEGVPVMTNDPGDTAKGALLSLGAAYETVGEELGKLGGRILHGEEMGQFGVEDHAPEVLTINEALLPGFPGWTLNPELKTRLDAGSPGTPPVVRPPAGRVFRLALVNLVQNKVLDMARDGFLLGLKDAGLREGTDFSLHEFNAQGEMANLPMLLQRVQDQGPDLVVTLTTPVMVAAVKQIRKLPLVFAVASNPAVIGLFDDTNRPANITGVHDDPPVMQLLEKVRGYMPDLQSIGTIYDPSQVNSMVSVKKLRLACRDQKIGLKELTASKVSELPLTVAALLQQGVDAVFLSADNLVSSGFSIIRQAADEAGVPVFTTELNLVAEGAKGAVGDDYSDWGRQAAGLVVKILSGERPADLPIEATRPRTVFDPGFVRAQAPLVKRGRAYRVRIVRYNDAQFSLETLRGIMAGFREAGLVEGKDVDFRSLSAQGDMSTLSSIVSSVMADEPDLIMPVSTPALQAVLRHSAEYPVVFSSVADAVRAGAGESETHHLPHVTGITTRSPFDEMAALIRETFPRAKKVGTLFTPAEVNSEIYRAWFEEALGKRGIELVAVPVSSSAETAEATNVLLRSGIELIAQIADNATRPGYAQIIRRASDEGVAFFCFDSAGMKDGAALALARDYYHTGREAAQVGLRVLKGQSPRMIPFANTRTQVLVVNTAVFKGLNVVLPDTIMARAIPYAE